MKYEMIGRVYYKGQKMKFSSGLEKVEIGITRTDGSAYPNVMFEAIGNAVVKAEAVKEGSLVKIDFDIQGKTYNTKDGVQRNLTVLKINDIVIVSEPKPAVEELLTPVTEEASS